MNLYRGEFAPGHPEFAAGSAAVCGAAVGPLATDAPDIVYSAEDEKVLETYNRNSGECS